MPHSTSEGMSSEREVLAGLRQHLARRAAIEAQDRALGALVEVVEHRAVNPGIGDRPGCDIRLARGQPQEPAGCGAHGQLPEDRGAPQAARSGASGSRAGRSRHWSTTSRSTRSGCTWANASPTAPQSCTSIRTRSDFDRVEEALDEAGVLVDRVLQVAGLARASEVQVGQGRGHRCAPGRGPSRRSWSAPRGGRAPGRRPGCPRARCARTPACRRVPRMGYRSRRCSR